jgi:catechol 2,3-dioxygenase-like lactoylglutathione lyase family enzyme
MTQIGGFIRPTRRPGALGVHSLDLFNFAVPDLARAADFYRAFGLDVREEGSGLGLYTSGHAHRWGRVVEGPAKRLQIISVGAFEDDIGRFRARMQEARVAQLDPPPGFETNGIWLRDPDGMLIEIRVAEKSSPNGKAMLSQVSAPPGTQGAPSRSRVPFVRPRRLAHVLMFTADVARAIAFYGDVLGLRLSDRSGDGIAFLHGIHGSDHHMIAFARSQGGGLHHLSWDVGSFDEVGLGAMQMADKGFAAGWGVGRHVLGSNYFHYVRDPWGSWCEYSADIDYIPVDHDWASGDHPAEDAFYVWGPTPPADFTTNHELGASGRLS